MEKIYLYKDNAPITINEESGLIGYNNKGIIEVISFILDDELYIDNIFILKNQTFNSLS